MHWTKSSNIPQDYFCFHSVENPDINGYGLYLNKSSDDINTSIFLRENVLNRVWEKNKTVTKASIPKYFDDAGINYGLLSMHTFVVP